VSEWSPPSDGAVAQNETVTRLPRSPLALSALVNLRDLGGIPVRGGTVRAGAVFRSDDVSTAHPEEGERLRARGLRTVIDLRSAEEAAHTGRGVLDGDDIDYHHLPLTATVAAPVGPGEGLRALTTPAAVGQWYARLAAGDAGTLVTGFEVVAASPGPVLFHCAAGKDRTGVFAASLLTVLGAEPEAIIADYALTDAVMPAILARLEPFFASLLGEHHDPWDVETSGAILAAPAESMATMLELLDREPGGFLGVLRRGGLTDAIVDRLRVRLVRPD
jgi:protein-tyrosine phosphatase